MIYLISAENPLPLLSGDILDLRQEIFIKKRLEMMHIGEKVTVTIAFKTNRYNRLKSYVKKKFLTSI